MFCMNLPNVVMVELWSKNKIKQLPADTTSSPVSSTPRDVFLSREFAAQIYANWAKSVCPGAQLHQEKAAFKTSTHVKCRLLRSNSRSARRFAGCQIYDVTRLSTGLVLYQRALDSSNHELLNFKPVYTIKYTKRIVCSRCLMPPSARMLL